MADRDSDSAVLRENLKRVLAAARANATAKERPTLGMARAWHSTMMTGLEPDPPAQRSWFGRFRGEEGQERVGVRVGSLEGTHPDLSLMSWVHNEWVRIHPFATGNGRIAQVWANWVAMRYGLPPFVRLRPRPSGDGYARAAGAAMSGQVLAMVPVFRDVFLAYPAGGTGSKPS